MRHIDLFSGIGGFALALDNVYGKENIQHTFCEIDPFCQAVLRKHWPGAYIHTDVRTIADTRSAEPGGLSSDGRKEVPAPGSCDFLTGGFPCQPFSTAGRRKGTSDDRYLWPPMFDAIKHFRPRWVIAENVRGLVTWNDGLVLETVCTDLEKEGYEVWPFIIPACGIEAPHRRYRVWFVAHHSTGIGLGKKNKIQAGRNGVINADSITPDTTGKRMERRSWSKPSKSKSIGHHTGAGREWNQDWLEVATRLCGVDDGLPTRMDGSELSKSAHRRERLKALGNAIVPQVAEQIFRAISLFEI